MLSIYHVTVRRSKLGPEADFCRQLSIMNGYGSATIHDSIDSLSYYLDISITGVISAIKRKESSHLLFQVNE
jgi:hypothetical protein